MRDPIPISLQPAFAGAAVPTASFAEPPASLRPIALRVDFARVLKASTLALSGLGAAMLVPLTVAPVFSGVPHVATAAGDEQLRAVGIAPLSAGSETGRQMAPSSAVEPLAQAPRRPARTTPAIRAAMPAPVTIRVRGRIAYGLHDALRMAQIAPAPSATFIKLLSAKLNLARDVGPDDHFDLVIAGVPRSSGEHDGALLYAAIDRAGASDVRLMKWGAGARAAWIDTAAAERRSGSMVWPVAGRISSGFGLRYHPILHFARMHRGVDFAAGWGQPVLAATDGIVSRAGWAGGYGKQVRIAHASGLATSYSHLGRLTVAPGSAVRAGQLIGYVGSTGLSTGPHLHYEVYRGGVAINPLSARFAAPSPLERGELERFRARLGQIMEMRAVAPRG